MTLPFMIILYNKKKRFNQGFNQERFNKKFNRNISYILAINENK